MTFRVKYFSLTVLLFLVEVWIALFVSDRFIRPFVGDVLVVILIYCLLQSFWRLRPSVAIASVFGFACVVEGLQYWNIVDRFGLRQNRVLAIAIGTTFDVKDILAYAIGAAIVLGLEQARQQRSLKP